MADSLDWLYKKYKDRILRFAYYRTKNWNDAEDVTQEVFIRVLKNLHRLSKPDSFFSWAYSIMVNAINDLYRKKKRAKTADIAEYAENLCFYDGGGLSNDDRLSLLSAMESLSQVDRDILYFKYFENMSIAEIANSTGQSESGIKTRIFRARERLKSLLEVDGPLPKTK